MVSDGYGESTLVGLFLVLCSVECHVFSEGYEESTVVGLLFVVM